MPITPLPQFSFCQAYDVLLSHAPEVIIHSMRSTSLNITLLVTDNLGGDPVPVVTIDNENQITIAPQGPNDVSCRVLIQEMN